MGRPRRYWLRARQRPVRLAIIIGKRRIRNPVASVQGGKKAASPPAASSDQQPPPRVPFTAAEDAVASIPGIPDARFWANLTTDFINALPAQPGPWLVLSSGGGDGAFGAGLVVGLGAAGNRPEYSVVTGVSTGALMAPFIFAGQRYDDTLRGNYTKLSAADVFEAGRTSESFVNSWPLKEDDRQGNHAGAPQRISRPNIVVGGVCLSQPSTSTPNALSSGIWARLRLMAARMGFAVSDRAACFDRRCGRIPAGVD